MNGAHSYNVQQLAKATIYKWCKNSRICTFRQQWCPETNLRYIEQRVFIVLQGFLNTANANSIQASLQLGASFLL